MNLVQSLTRLPLLRVIVVMSLMVGLAIASTLTVHSQEDPIFEEEYTALAESIYSVAWSPTGQWIAMGVGPERCRNSANNYGVRLVDPSSGLVVNYVGAGLINCPITHLDWSPNGEYIVTSGVDENAVVWDISTLSEIAVFATRSMPGFSDHAWSPVGNLIATSDDANPSIFIWDPTNGALINEFNAERPQTISWSPDGNVIAGANEFTGLKLWSPTNGQLIANITNEPVREIAWSSDGTIIAAANDDNSIALWEVATGNQLIRLLGHTDQIFALDWSAVSAQIASASKDGTVRVWNIGNGQNTVVAQHLHPILDVDWDHKGVFVAFGVDSLEEGLPSVVIVRPHQLQRLQIRQLKHPLLHLPPPPPLRRHQPPHPPKPRLPPPPPPSRPRLLPPRFASRRRATPAPPAGSPSAARATRAAVKPSTISTADAGSPLPIPTCSAVSSPSACVPIAPAAATSACGSAAPPPRRSARWRGRTAAATTPRAKRRAACLSAAW